MRQEQGIATFTSAEELAIFIGKLVEESTAVFEVTSNNGEYVVHFSGGY